MLSTAAEKPTVLVLLGAYWPGNDATGPNQSFRALVGALSQDYKFKVVARDRPRGAAATPPKVSAWIEEHGIAVYRCPVSPLGAVGLREVLRTTSYDALVLNGFFDREFSIPALLLRRASQVRSVPTLLSPRGEFSGGALSLKSGRKRVYLQAARALGLFTDVWLHATGEEERADIEAAFSWSRGVLVAPNLRPPLRPAPRAERADGVLRVAFLSRIDRMKNLDYAIRVLASVSVPVRLDIFGPVTHPDHKAECERLIDALPPHVGASFKGAIPNSEVFSTLSGYELFFLPTRGENFGHAIFDALEAGVPVLLSDRTPWQDIEQRGAGWTLPLDRPDLFKAAIEKLAEMPHEERLRLRRGARGAAEAAAADPDAIARNQAMLRTLLASTLARSSGAQHLNARTSPASFSSRSP
jgi:glycosyltransferase involved in cell wall biosynthesis